MFYAIAKGRTIGIVNTWSECLKAVTGFSGAVFKKFQTKDEATIFISQNTEIKADTNIGLEINKKGITNFSLIEPMQKSKRENINENINEIIIYTDGSCKNKSGGFGVVLLTKEEVIKEYCGKVPYNPCTNNIAELYALFYVFNDIIPTINDVNKIIINSDSEYSINAISVLYDEHLKRNFNNVKNKELIQTIHNLLEKHKENGCNIVFKHVKAHCGIEYNERADKLAEKGRCQ